MKINYDKSIGNVVFIVEGAKTEFDLLWVLFVKLLGYQMETQKRGLKYKKFNESSDTTLRVFVINSLESNINFIDSDEGYLDDIFNALRYEYELDVENAAIYYIFDRDPLSNTDTDRYRKLVARLTNSRENENYDEGGLLLISYPSVEAYTLSAFEGADSEASFGTGKEVKQYLHEKQIVLKKIEIEGVKLTAESMLQILQEHGEFDIDDLGQLMLDTFDDQEKRYELKNVYTTLSCLSIALIDLGIIEL